MGGLSFQVTSFLTRESGTDLHLQGLSVPVEIGRDRTEGRVYRALRRASSQTEEGSNKRVKEVGISLRCGQQRSISYSSGPENDTLVRPGAEPQVSEVSHKSRIQLTLFS